MIRLGFTGDIMLGREVGQKLYTDPDTKLFSDELMDKFNEFDFLVGNLECPITKEEEPIRNELFKAAPDTLNYLSSFHLMSLANNHIFDCGKNGAKDTINYLLEFKLAYAGLIYNEDEIIYKVIIKGKKFGFISAATTECIKNDSDLVPQIVNANDSKLLTLIKNESVKLDYLIVSMHGGNEMIAYPEPSFRRLCKSFVDAGASAIITHHPHVLGGVEYYKNSPIVYSLGDFVFDGQSHLRRRGAILEIEILNDELRCKIYPTVITSILEVKFASGKNLQKIKLKWGLVSANLLKLDYDEKYKIRYISHLVNFQKDRLAFLYNTKGFIAAADFALNKLWLGGFYLKKILFK